MAKLFSKTSAKLVLIAVLIAIVGLASHYFPGPLKLSDAANNLQVHRSPSGLMFALQVDTNTLTVQRESLLTLRTTRAVSNGPFTLLVKAAAMGFETNATSEQLERGLPIRLTPSRPGIFPLVLEADGQVLSTVSLCVTFGPELGPGEGLTYSLGKGSASINGAGVFQVPIMAFAKERRGETQPIFVPKPMAEDVILRIVDQKGQIDPLYATIRKGNAASDPIRLPISLQAQYCLVLDGVPPETDQCLGIDWSNDVPHLEIQVFATRKESFATTLTPVEISVWLTCRGILVPARAFPSPIWQGDRAVRVDEILTSGSVSSNDIRTFLVTASSAVEKATVNVRYPQLSLARSVEIRFVSPLNLLFLAFLFGVGGVLLARLNTFAEMWARNQFARVVLELICTALCAVLLYAAILLRIVPIKVEGTMLVGTLPAVVFGLVGGFMGTGVFHLIIGLLNLVPKGPKPPDVGGPAIAGT